MAAPDDTAPARWVNFLANPSFEGWFGPSTSSWNKMNEAWAVTFNGVNAPSRHGTATAELSSKVGGGSVAQDVSGSFNGGHEYEWEVWVRVPDYTPLPVDVSVAMWALGNDQELGYTDYTLNDHGWHLLATKLKPVRYHSTLRAEIYMHSTYRSVHVDAASLFRAGVDRGSFEGSTGNWTKINAAGAVNFSLYQAFAYAQQGTWFAKMSTYEQGGSVGQDLYPSTKLSWGVPGNEREYCFSAYVRSPSGVAMGGTLAIWTLGGDQQEVAMADFTAGPYWSRRQTCIRPMFNHSGLRVEIYLNTTNVTLDVDSAHLT